MGENCNKVNLKDFFISLILYIHQIHGIFGEAIFLLVTTYYFYPFFSFVLNLKRRNGFLLARVSVLCLYYFDVLETNLLTPYDTS